MCDAASVDREHRTSSLGVKVDSCRASHRAPFDSEKTEAETLFSIRDPEVRAC